MSESLVEKIEMAYRQVLRSFYMPSAWPKRFESRVLLAAQLIQFFDGNLNGRSILDVGCGACDFMMLLREFGASSLIGVEPYPLTQDDFRDEFVVKQLFTGMNPIVRRLELDADYDSLPLPEDSIDIALLIDVIEHLNDPDFCLTEITRVLKPRGLLVIRTPNASNLRRRIKTLLGASPNAPTLMNWLRSGRHIDHKRKIRKFVGHIREYTLKELKQICNLYGLAPTHVRLSPIQYARVQKPAMKLYNMIERLYPNFAYEILIIAKKTIMRSN